MDLENIKSFKSVKLFSKNWGAGVVFLGFFLANEIQKKANSKDKKTNKHKITTQLCRVANRAYFFNYMDRRIE